MKDREPQAIEKETSSGSQTKYKSLAEIKNERKDQTFGYERHLDPKYQYKALDELKSASHKDHNYMTKPFKPFHFKTLAEISDRFIEAKNEELRRHHAEEDHSRLPKLRLLQINFILPVLKALKNESEMSAERKNIIATAVVRLQKLLILIDEYKKDKEKNRVVNWLEGVFSLNDPKKSYMYVVNDEIIGHSTDNDFEPYQNESLLELRNYLLEDNQLDLTVSSEALPKTKVINFIQDRLLGLKIQQVNLKQSKVQEPAEFNYVAMKKRLLENIQSTPQLKPTKTLDLKQKFLTEIENFDHEKLKHVETVEKKAPLVMKVFKPKDNAHSKSEKSAHKRRSTRSHKRVPPNSPACR